LGEGCPWDEALLERVTSASICCGFHAGGESTILPTLRAAKDRGVVVGAHPGYPDREGFGRREQAIATAEVERLIREQVVALAAMADRVGVPICFLKPHGALYNQAQRDEAVAAGVIAAASALGLPVLGLPGGQVEALAGTTGVRFLAEGFADRRYRADGQLVPRTEPDALLHDPAEIEAQVLRLVGRGIDTLCLHGDNPDSIRLADLIRSALNRAGITARSVL
ncbi:MAG: LamB/YcsF family protein, partial [Isosphaeraceae bacterium]|nr:LamB/YcsF family protein [Isosphaeraceae bacterium]